MDCDQLKLDNQLCFPVYAASRLIIREYQPYLDQLGITYPQYLVMLVLWEEDNIPVTTITSRLILNTNTVTPLLKRLEKINLISRVKSTVDERKVNIVLTPKGNTMKLEAAEIPLKLSEGVTSSNFDIEELLTLKNTLHKLIDHLNK